MSKTERKNVCERQRETKRQKVCVDYINGCSLEWKAWRRSLLPPRLCLLALATLQTARLDIAFNNIWSCFFAYSLFAALPHHQQPILPLLPFFLCLSLTPTYTHTQIHTFLTVHTHQASAELYCMVNGVETSVLEHFYLRLNPTSTNIKKNQIKQSHSMHILHLHNY